MALGGSITVQSPEKYLGIEVLSSPLLVAFILLSPRLVDKDMNYLDGAIILRIETLVGPSFVHAYLVAAA